MLVVNLILILLINLSREETVPAEVISDIFLKVTNELREQLNLNLNNKAPISKRDTLTQNATSKPTTTNTTSVKPTSNTTTTKPTMVRLNPFFIKASPDSIKLHNSFMQALKEHKTKLKSGLNTTNGVKLKASPQFCPFQQTIDCDEKSKYRQIDGSCNNLNNPLLGKSSTPFKRFLPSVYEDKLDEPRRTALSGNPLPNPRSISLILHDPNDIPTTMTNLGVMLGQFIDHDFAQSAGVTGSDGQVLKCTCDSIDSDCINISNYKFLTTTTKLHIFIF